MGNITTTITQPTVRIITPLLELSMAPQKFTASLKEEWFFRLKQKILCSRVWVNSRKQIQQNPTLRTIAIDFNQYIRFTYVAKNLEFLLRALSVRRSNFTLLDVGAGLGGLSEYFLTKFRGFAINIDISKEHKLRNLVVADCRKVPFRNNSFDFVSSTDVLEHIKYDYRGEFVKELLRCSKFGIVITYSKIHKDNPLSSGIRLFEKLCRNPPYWYTDHNLNELVDDSSIIDLLKKNSAQVVEAKPLSGVFAVFFTGLRCLTDRLLTTAWSRLIFNMISYSITKLVDPPPYYNFGLVALKHKEIHGVEDITP
jgi:2-polyprenyl-3-methyl-5-hydroxy-6-metoxy-1,4-benzoquinol methylase